jgi:hypothetical protein
MLYFVFEDLVYFLSSEVADLVVYIILARYFPSRILVRSKQNKIQLQFAASPLSMQHLGVKKEKNGCYYLITYYQ